MKNVYVRSITGIVFVAVIVFTILFASVSLWPFYLLFLFFSLVGTWEALKMVERKGFSPHYVVGMIAAASLFSIPMSSEVSDVSMIWAWIPITILLVAPYLLIFLELFGKNEHPMANITLTLFPLFWVVFPFMLMFFFLTPLSAGDANLALLSAFVAVWLNDTGAYCAGNLWGKHPLCPRLSPKKTVEGFVGGLVLTLVLMQILGATVLKNSLLDSWYAWIGFSLIVVIFSTLGDLLESRFKRDCGVKDSGRLLPGHGGVLDRFDSIFLVMPSLFFYFIILDFFKTF